MPRALVLLFLLSASLSPAMAADGYSGAEIYAQTCALCHSAGTGGAPRMGQFDDWQGRKIDGRANLLLSVLRGKGGMPPKGGNASLSASEANAALEYMLANSSRR